MRFLRSGSAALLLIPLALTASADEVVLVPDSPIPSSGGRVRGKIDRETPELVRIGAREIPLDQIAEVSYDGPGVSYSQARLMESNGDLNRAVELFEKAAQEASQPLVILDARYRAAAGLARLGLADPSRRDEAIETLQTLTRELSSSRHYGPALELLAELHLAAQDYDAADEALRELAGLSWAADRATVLQAQVKVKRGQSEQALRDLDSLTARLPDGGAAHRQADLVRAEALAALERFEEAEQAVRAVIDAADPEDSATLAPAYNTLGDCLRAAGKPRDALFAYLHTEILYPESADEHARALAAIAQLWQLLDRPDRASAIIDRLEREFPNSPHLPAARRSAP